MSDALIAFIRHGEYAQLPNTPSALQPFALTEEGKVQARNCATTLQEAAQYLNVPINSTIYCSTSLRAWQTASEIAQQLPLADVQIEQTDELCERSVGALANLTIEQIEQAIFDDPRFPALPQNWKSDSDFRLPVKGAESLLDSGRRVASYVQHKVQVNSTSLTCFVGHGASIRHAAYQMGILSFNEIAKLSMYHAQPVIFKRLEQQWHLAFGDWKHRGAKTSYTD